MSRHITWVLTLALACAPAAAAAAHDQQPSRPDKARSHGDGKDRPATGRSAPDDRERRKWWLYSKAELGLTEQQSKQINHIFETTLPKLRETRHETEAAEHELSRTIKEHKADLATISLLIDRVESARSQHTKLRVLMLYQMDQLLSPEQRTKLQALRERQEAERKEKEASREHPRTP